MILKELKKYASAKRKTTNEWFFKTGKGQYGDGQPSATQLSEWKRERERNF